MIYDKRNDKKNTKWSTVVILFPPAYISQITNHPKENSVRESRHLTSFTGLHFCESPLETNKKTFQNIRQHCQKLKPDQRKNEAITTPRRLNSLHCHTKEYKLITSRDKYIGIVREIFTLALF